MDDKLETLLRKLKLLEDEMLVELHKKEKEFSYKVHERKVHFQESVLAGHQRLVKRISRYLYEAKPLNILTAPMIWSCLVPALLMHAWAVVYQFICFPVYGIPKVRARDYIFFDRNKLGYLNSIEKFNCAYCGYVNGLIAYLQEIAGRTEQYWCPIKHAVRQKTMHSRYQRFLDYGDAEKYRKSLEEVRRAFEDLKKP